MRNFLVICAVALMIYGCGASKAHYSDDSVVIEVEAGGSVRVYDTDKFDNAWLEVKTPDPMPLYEKIVEQNEDILGNL